MFTVEWDPPLIRLSAAVYFYSSKLTNSSIDKAIVLGGSMPPICHVGVVRSVIEKAGLKNMDLVYNDG